MIAVIVLSVPLAGTFAVLAARYPDPGGVASYVRRSLGDTAARVTGYWFMFGVCAGAPVVAVLGAEYVVAIAGIDRTMVPVIAFAILVPPFVANVFGVRVAGWVQFVLTALLLAVVVGVVSLAAPSVEPQNFARSSPTGGPGSARRSACSSGRSRDGRSARTSRVNSAIRAVPSRSARRSRWSSQASATWCSRSSLSAPSATPPVSAPCRCSNSRASALPGLGCRQRRGRSPRSWRSA